MSKITLILKALLGYAGSSENPQAMSLRMMGIITGVIGVGVPYIFPVLITLGVHLPFGVTADTVSANLTPIAQAFVYLGAASMWIIGAIRAVVVQLNTPVVLP